MNNSYIGTAIVIRDLHCYSIGTINERILLQKKVYLAQDIGLPLGYGYNWYIHGPYSTDLTTAAYQIVPEGTSAIEGYKLKSPYSEMVSKVNSLGKEEIINSLQLNIVQWYELLSSIAYWYSKNIKDKKDIVERLKLVKPQFSENQVKTGYAEYIAFKKSGDGK